MHFVSNEQSVASGEEDDMAGADTDGTDDAGHNNLARRLATASRTKSRSRAPAKTASRTKSRAPAAKTASPSRTKTPASRSRTRTSNASKAPGATALASESPSASDSPLFQGFESASPSFTPSPSNTVSPSTDQGAQNTQSSSGLAPVVTTGIIVGALVGALLLAIVLYLVCTRRKSDTSKQLADSRSASASASKAGTHQSDAAQLDAATDGAAPTQTVLVSPVATRKKRIQKRSSRHRHRSDSDTSRSSGASSDHSNGTSSSSSRRRRRRRDRKKDQKAALATQAAVAQPPAINLQLLLDSNGAMTAVPVQQGVSTGKAAVAAPVSSGRQAEGHTSVATPESQSQSPSAVPQRSRTKVTFESYETK